MKSGTNWRISLHTDPMLKILAILAALLGIPAVIFGYVRYLEKSAVFFPGREVQGTPRDLGLEYQDIIITVEDNLKINAWFVPAAPARYAVLLCHGNAGNISTRLEKIRLLHSLGLSVFIFDYRGYGRSQGSPTEAGVYADAQAAYEYLTQDLGLPSQKIIIYGESLGGAVAVELAGKAGSAGLILESTFSSGKDMARLLYPFLPGFIFSVKFDSLDKVGDISVPKLFIHSSDDEIVPLSLSRKLYSKAAEPKYFLQIRGPHNDAYSVCREEFLKGIGSFLDRI